MNEYLYTKIDTEHSVFNDKTAYVHIKIIDLVGHMSQEATSPTLRLCVPKESLGVFIGEIESLVKELKEIKK